MNTTPKYDALQQIFSLNWLSNVASGKTGSVAQLQAQATAAIDQVLADPATIALIGQYERVWGPVVYQFPGGDGKPASTVADNLMYVATTATAAGVRYVVAIAYTNPISWYDWLVEDVSISQMVAWPGVPGAMISAGANTGLGILLGMTSNGQSLLGFLEQATRQAGGACLEVVTCGHSLGGTLSPLLALALVEQQGQAGGWDQDRSAVVSSVPSAGFSPGNLDFANYFEAMLGFRTTRLWNSLDMVPAGWNPDSLRHSAYLYYPYIVPNRLVLLNTDLTIAMSKASGQTYMQYNRNTAPLPGQVELGIASFQFNLPGEVRVKIAGKVAAALATKLGLPQLAGAGLQRVIETVLNDFLARWSAGGNTAGIRGIAREAAQGVRGLLSSVTDKLGSLLDDILAEIEGMLVFYAEVFVQHMIAYGELLGVTEFMVAMHTASALPKAASPGEPTILSIPGVGATAASSTAG